MKKLIFIIIAVLFLCVDMNAQKIKYYGKFVTLSSLYTSLNMPIYSFDIFCVSVIGGKCTLTQTGAQVQNILDGTMDLTIDLTGTATNQIQLPLSNDNVTPTLAFGDGNSGFYESTDNKIILSLASGTNQWEWLTTHFTSFFGRSGAMMAEDATNINPVWAFADDFDTGLGHPNGIVDNMSIVSGGAEIIRVTPTGVIVNSTLNFAADAQADDDYEISIPGVSALTTGLTVTFSATTLNTDAATLEITEVGDIDALVKVTTGGGVAVALATGDVIAKQIIVAVFDADGNWQIVSRLAQ